MHLFKLQKQSHREKKKKKGLPRFSDNLRGDGVVVTLLKKTLWHRCFPVNFAKFLRTPFSYSNRIRPVDASETIQGEQNK